MPNVSDEYLLNTLEDWISNYICKCLKIEDIYKLDLLEILENSFLDWKKKKILDAEAPTHYTAPSGSKIKINYNENENPYIRVKIQEMFGCVDTPRICNNIIPLIIHLLSPAQRPIQITDDLKNFWDSTYFQVKKELKGRYPKHPWPDEPYTAQPTKYTKKR